jgi:hypothetical protein
MKLSPEVKEILIGLAIGIIAGLLVLLFTGCGQDRSQCDGVDTSQAPISIDHGNTMDTYCWTDTCCITYYK